MAEGGGRRGRRRSNANVLVYTEENNPFNEANREQPVDVPGDNLESDGIPSVDSLGGNTSAANADPAGPPRPNFSASDSSSSNADPSGPPRPVFNTSDANADPGGPPRPNFNTSESASNADPSGPPRPNFNTGGEGETGSGDSSEGAGGVAPQFVPPRRARGRARGRGGGSEASSDGGGGGPPDMDAARAAAMAAVAAVAEANPSGVVDTVVEEVKNIRLNRRRRSQTIEPGSQSEAPILVKDGVVYTPAEFVQSHIEDKSSEPPRPPAHILEAAARANAGGAASASSGTGSDEESPEKEYPDNVINGIRLGQVTAIKQAGEDDEEGDEETNDSDDPFGNEYTIGSGGGRRTSRPPPGPIDLGHVVSALQIANPVQFEFDYYESDTLGTELNEFFSYHEVVYEIPQAQGSAEPIKWESSSLPDRDAFVSLNLERLEHCSADVRRQGARNLFYTLFATHLEDSAERLQIVREVSEALADTSRVCSTIIQAIVVIMNSTKNSPEHAQSTSDFRLYFNLLYPVLLFNRYHESLKDELIQPVIGTVCPLQFVFNLLMESNTNVGDDFSLPLKKLLLTGWKMLIAVTGGLEVVDNDKPPKPYMCATPVPDPEESARAKKAMAPSSPPLARKGADKGGKAHAPFGEQPAEEDDDVISVTSTVSGMSIASTSSLKAHAKDIAWHRDFMDKYRRRDGGVPSHVQDGHALIQALVHRPAAELRGEVENRLTMDNPPGGELVYRALLPNHLKYVIVMLKTLLAASPTVKNYTGSVVIGVESPVFEGAKRTLSANEVDFDLKRHKEVIVKAISAILLLLLKHFRFSALFQSDYLAQNLTDTNCILLILKFVNQDLAQYFCRDYEVSDLLFLPGVDKRTATATVPETYQIDASWRDIFTAVNLIRILQKLTKDRPVRIKTMITFKAQVILRRLLKADTPVLKFYALKLLKSQARFLGRKWVNSNMKVITKIYTHVRPSLHDPWLNCDPNTLPDDSSKVPEQRVVIGEANMRHYHDLLVSGDDDRTVQGVPKDGDSLYNAEDYMYTAEATYDRLMREVQLDDEFKNNYEAWLEREVYAIPA